MMWRFIFSGISIGLIFIGMAFSQIPQTLSYQGIFSDAQGNLLTGDYDFNFKIYNQATGGSELWSEAQILTVTEGLLNVALGDVNPLNLEFNETYWLGITIGTGSEMTPRLRLNASAYSLNALTVVDSAITASKLADESVVSAKIHNGAITAAKIDTQQVVKSLNNLKDNVTLAQGANITITQSDNTLTISSSGGSGGLSLPYAGSVSAPSAVAFEVTNNGSGGQAIKGIASDASSNNKGVYGQSNSHLGAGVYGTGLYAGVLGFGVNGAPDSINYGVLGQTNELKGHGVAGIATALSGNTYGVYGESMADGGIGIAGIASTMNSGVSNYSYGVYGRSYSDHSFAVYGLIESGATTGGNSHAVYGKNTLSHGKGVTGIAESTSGLTKGVVGEVISNQGVGVYGVNNALNTTINGRSIGVKGVSMGTEGIGISGRALGADGVGVVGHNESADHWGYLGTPSYAVYGLSSSDTNKAVYGLNDQTGASGSLGGMYGVEGRSVDSCAVRGQNTTSNNYGYVGGALYSVYGEHAGTGNFGFLGSANYGVQGRSTSQFGVFGVSTDADGVIGFSQNLSGVSGESQNLYGVYGQNLASGNYGYIGSMDYGVYGRHTMEGTAVFGENIQKGNIGALGGFEYGVYGVATYPADHAGYFVGHGYFSGFLGLGMMNPSYRLELPNDPNSYNGRAIAVEWITYSSGRWKENITPIPNALEKLMQLTGVEFDWKVDRGGHRDIGLIAEDVARVMPGVVHMEDDGINARGLDYARLVPLLIEAVKAQQLEIEHLKQQITLSSDQ
jgi:hypothetical protein